MRIGYLASGLSVAAAQNFRQLALHHKHEGVTGYDLIDRLDIWYGHNSPEYSGPHRVLDAIGDSNGRVTLGDWAAAGLPADHFSYFDRDGSGELDVHEAHSWHQQRKGARTMNLEELKHPPKGHMEPLGGWKAPLPSDDLVYRKPYPHPRDFWKKHMDGYLPAVFKGAQHGWPAMNWTKEDLVRRFGWVDAKLEPKIEGRGNSTAYADLDAMSPDHRLNLSEYIRREEGNNVYVVSIIPQAMAWEVAHPSSILCGSRRKILDRNSKPPYKVTDHEYPHESGFNWMTHVFEANLWMATGVTRSQLHYDKEWNVNCLLSGTKRWFFLNPFWYGKDLQWSRGEKFVPEDPLNNKWTDWVYLDAEHVDLIVQHKLREMDYYELIQEAGDCVLIPYAMLHQVTKMDSDFQVAASWMFLPETIYSEEDCEDAILHKDLPLAAMDTLYMYSGRGLIPQGYADPIFTRRNLVKLMKRRGEEFLTMAALTQIVSEGDSIINSLGKKEKTRRIAAMYEELLKHAKSLEGLSVEELQKVPLRKFTRAASEGDPEGALPCDTRQEYFPCTDEEFAKMNAFVEAELAAARALVKNSTSVPSGANTTQVRNRRVWKEGPPRFRSGSKNEL